MPRSPVRQHALLALVFSLFSAASAAQSPRLDFDDALRRAADQAPALRAQDAAARAARERAVAAAQLPDPMLRLGVANLPADGPERFSLTRDFMTMRNIGIAREFTRQDKRSARAAGFEAEALVALAQRDERQATLQQATALAWLERQDLERLQTLIERQRDEARLLVEAVEAAYRGGRGSAVEALAARSEVATLDDRLFGVKARIAQAQATLERYVGAEAARWALGERPDVSRLVAARAGEAGLETTPMLATLGREVSRAEADVATARSERRGDWSAEVMFSQRGPQYSNMLSLTFSVPLTTSRAERQDREVASRHAALERTRAEHEDARRAQRERWAALEAQWRSALERGALHERELLPLAAERARLALSAYRAGNGTLAALFDARRAELGAQIERLQQDSEAARAWAQINALFSGVTP
jgi:outer membrane protein TolC